MNQLLQAIAQKKERLDGLRPLSAQALKASWAAAVGGLPLELRVCLDVARNLKGWPGGREAGSGTPRSAGREAFSW